MDANRPHGSESFRVEHVRYLAAFPTTRIRGKHAETNDGVSEEDSGRDDYENKEYVNLLADFWFEYGDAEV